MQNALKRIRDFVLAAERGDFSKTLSETSEGELGEIERSVNRLVNELRGSRGEKVNREAIEKELRISRAIQSSLLPTHLPEVPGIELAAIYRPALEIGGDYYDLIDIDSAHLGIAIADVSGKSISGAMFMTITRNTIRAQAMLTLSPREVLQRTERLLTPSMMPGFFVSIFYAVLDKETSRVSCANAGHPPLLLFRFEKRECEWVRPRGIAVGLVRNRPEGFQLEEREFALDQGDFAFFYTDGIPDALGEGGSRFGRDRILELATESGRQGAAGFLASLDARLSQFTANQPIADDITAVVMGRSHA